MATKCPLYIYSNLKLSESSKFFYVWFHYHVAVHGLCAQFSSAYRKQQANSWAWSFLEGTLKEAFTVSLGNSSAVKIEPSLYNILKGT